MHVCVITRNLNVKNGVATHVNHLIAQLEKQGIEVTVLAGDVNNGRVGGSECCRILPFNEFDRAADPRNLLFPALSLNRKVAALHRRKPIDLIHFHDSIAFTALRPVVRLLGIPTFFTVHSLYIARPETSPYPPSVARKYRLANRCALRRADRVLCVSSETRQRAAQLAGESERLLVVPNFIDLPGGATPLHASPASPETIIFVGTLSPIKGVEHLLAAAPLVLAHHPRARFLIVGDGSERQRLEAQCDALNLRAQVEFAGRVEREATAEWYCKAGIMAVPSLDEAQGIVVLEAFAHGLPVVASRVGGIPDMVEEGVSGLLVPPGDAEALAAGINRLLDERDLWARCAAGAAAAAGRYSWERGILRIIALYNEVTRS